MEQFVNLLIKKKKKQKSEDSAQFQLFYNLQMNAIT